MLHSKHIKAIWPWQRPFLLWMMKPARQIPFGWDIKRGPFSLSLGTVKVEGKGSGTLSKEFFWENPILANLSILWKKGLWMHNNPNNDSHSDRVSELTTGTSLFTLRDPREPSGNTWLLAKGHWEQIPWTSGCFCGPPSSFSFCKLVTIIPPRGWWEMNKTIQERGFYKS